MSRRSDLRSMFLVIVPYAIPGLDTNGCPLGNSKFTLLSDNLNICLWLSACQVEKIYQNQIQIDTNVDNPISDLDVIYDFNQFNHKCFGYFFKTKFICSRSLFAPALVSVKSVIFLCHSIPNILNSRNRHRNPWGRQCVSY